MSKEKIYYTYMTASKRNGTLYVGVTSNIKRRIYEHKNGLIDGFTKKYKVDKLMHFETTNNIISAIQREKQIKKWNRKWKIELIEKENPCWKDLYYEL
jgi:putative endonuclease